MERELSGLPKKRRHSMRIDSPYKTVAEAAEFLRLSPQTLNNMRSNGRGPSYHRHGRRILYDVDELRSWSMIYKTTVTRSDDNFA